MRRMQRGGIDETGVWRRTLLKNIKMILALANIRWERYISYDVPPPNVPSSTRAYLAVQRAGSLTMAIVSVHRPFTSWPQPGILTVTRSTHLFIRSPDE